jgi:hypothetical protein
MDQANDASAFTLGVTGPPGSYATVDVFLNQAASTGFYATDNNAGGEYKSIKWDGALIGSTLNGDYTVTVCSDVPATTT